MQVLEFKTEFIENNLPACHLIDLMKKHLTMRNFVFDGFTTILKLLHVHLYFRTNKLVFINCI